MVGLMLQPLGGAAARGELLFGGSLLRPDAARPVAGFFFLGLRATDHATTWARVWGPGLPLALGAAPDQTGYRVFVSSTNGQRYGVHTFVLGAGARRLDCR